MHRLFLREKRYKRLQTHSLDKGSAENAGKHILTCLVTTCHLYCDCTSSHSTAKAKKSSWLHLSPHWKAQETPGIMPSLHFPDFLHYVTLGGLLSLGNYFPSMVESRIQEIKSYLCQEDLTFKSFSHETH